MVDPQFWQGKTVLLTGHTGFKGAWLSLWLQAMEADVHGFALDPPTTPSLFVEANVGSGMSSRTADIRTPGAIADCIDAVQPEIVFHMAAQPLVRASYDDPISTYETNVMGTVRLLDALRGADSARVVVNITSDKSYENNERTWGYRESDPVGGRDPYSNSKACSELVTSAYRRSFLADEGVAVASARAGNVIGGGDWAADRLVPDALRAFADHEAVTLRRPDAVRPWQHVLEPLSGYLALAEKLWAEPQAFAEAWNFGPADEDALPVAHVIEALTELWGDGATWQPDHDTGPHEASWLKLDISKARTMIGWHPTWTLDEALVRVVDWHRAWLAGEDMRTFTLDQIREFSRRSIHAS